MKIDYARFIFPFFFPKLHLKKKKNIPCEKTRKNSLQSLLVKSYTRLTTRLLITLVLLESARSPRPAVEPPFLPPPLIPDPVYRVRPERSSYIVGE